MATGANLQPGRGIATSSITPGVDFRTGEAEAWEQAGRVFKKFEDAARPNLIRRAQALGAAEGAAVAAGEAMPERSILFSGDIAEARTAALESAYVSRIRTDIDAREAEIRRENQYDPEAYDRAAREMRSGFIQGAPPEFAVDVEDYANTRVARGLETVSGARSQRDEQEANQALTVRIATLDERMIALAANGQSRSFEYLQADAERGALQEERVGNPAILYSDAQREADDDKLNSGVIGAVVTRQAVEVYTERGRGLPGYSAAVGHLRNEVLEGDAFADLDPESKQRIYRDAVSQLRDFTAADREETRANEEAERARRQERRDLVGEMRLGVLLGEVTESQIMQDETLTDADKAGLVAGARAQARRETTEARTAAALETAGRTASFNTYKDQAQAGTLSAAEIAEALNGGEITPGQAQTLRTLNDRTLSPIVDNVMAPVRDASNRPGASSRDRATSMARAEDQAARWVRVNPNATMEQRLQAGRQIADVYFGGGQQPGAGRPANQPGAAGQAQRLSALSAERASRQSRGNPMSTAEYNRRRTEIINGG